MPPRGLTVNDNSIVVPLCDWHLRKVFRDEDFIGKMARNEFIIPVRRIRERKNPSPKAPSLADAPYAEDFILVNATTNDEVARCQWFLEADKTTIAASGKPDPKEINWNGRNYHLVSKEYPECEHCKAGISTY